MTEQKLTHKLTAQQEDFLLEEAREKYFEDKDREKQNDKTKRS